jgi:leucyl aminopeptidase
MVDIAFARPALPKSGALVLLVSEGEMPSGLWQQADQATGGAIARSLGGGIQRAKGKTCTILAPGAGCRG